MSIAGGLYKSLLRGRDVGCQTVQIFLRSNMAWNPGKFTPRDVERFTQTQAETGIAPVVAHNCYLVNLASTDAATHERSLAAATDELRRAEALAVPYLVMHPGAHLGAGVKTGLRKVAKGLDEALRASGARNVRVLLETTAGQGTALGSRFEELAELISLSSFADRIGICYDTCHTFVAGYDIRARTAYRSTFRQLDRAVGLGKLRCFHLNDAKQGFGSHRDRHQHIGRGEIGLNGFGYLLNDKRFAQIPMILETPKGTYRRRPWDKINLATLRGLTGDARFKL
jgi:deoxyribonuclease-4